MEDLLSTKRQEDNLKSSTVIDANDIVLVSSETEWNFYKIIQTDSGNKIEIKHSGVLKYLENEGYRNLKMPNGGYELVKIERGSILVYADQADMMETLKLKIVDIDKQNDVWDMFLEKNYLVTQLLNAMKRIREVKLNQSTKTESYFFFENAVVRVLADKISLICYEDFDGFLFKDQIIPHHLEINDFSNGNYGMFNTFLFNVTNSDIKRFDYLTSTLGYLMHTYKDKALTKAVILVDEEIDYAGGAEGGTGKTLITDAMKFLVKTVVKDGRALVTKSNRFFYQDMELSHRLMVIDDVSPETPFDNFFSVITGGMVVEKKGKQAFTIPFELSPKMLITSNYIMKGNGGNSEERRKIEIEIAPYYRGKSLQKEFGCTFFGDWDSIEWNLFYNRMLSFCQKFLKYGIMATEPINLKLNSLIGKTDYSFVEFMDANVKFDGEKKEFKVEKPEFFNAYKTIYPIETKNLTINLFKKWCNLYANVKGHDISHLKSNSKSYLLISPKIIENCHNLKDNAVLDSIVFPTKTSPVN